MSLPSLTIWSGDAAEWDSYLDSVYNRFLQSFVRARLTFLGKHVKARWHPSHDEKHFCFWHVVSEQGETSSEDDRIVDTARCERIEWIGYILANVGNKDKVWCWCNERTGKRGREKRYLLYLHEERYLVVLAGKEDFFLLVTAYCVNRDHAHLKLVKEKERSSDPRD